MLWLLDGLAGRSHRHVSRVLLLASVAALVLASVALVRHLSPDTYTLRMVRPAAPDQPLASLLATRAQHEGVTLEWVDPADQVPALKMMVDGSADLCLARFPEDTPHDVGEVAPLGTEVLHVLVRAQLGATDLGALRGRRIAMGPPAGDLRRAASEVLAYAGLQAGADYLAVDASAAPSSERPDAVFVLAPPHSPIAIESVREWGYEPLAVPFAEALADTSRSLTVGRVPAFAYRGLPASPPEDITTIAVQRRLVAHARAPKAAIQKLLTIIADGAFASQADLPWFDESQLGQDTPFPLHEGAVAYLHRNEPLFTPEFIEETEDLRNFIGAGIFGTMLLWHWARRRRDRFTQSIVERVHDLEREALAHEVDPAFEPRKLMHIRHELTRIKAQIVERLVRPRGIEDEFVAKLVAHVDNLRHYLLAVLTHHHQTQGGMPKRSAGMLGTPPKHARASLEHATLVEQT